MHKSETLVLILNAELGVCLEIENVFAKSDKGVNARPKNIKVEKENFILVE